MPSTAHTKLLNTIWLILERGVIVAIAFIVMTLVARHLGPAGFGAYAYLFGIVALLMPVASFGIESVLMRDVLADEGSQFSTLGSAVALHLLGAALCIGIAIAAVAAFGGPEGVTPALMALAALNLLALPGNAVNAWFKARERMALVVLPRMAVAVLIGVAAYLLVQRDAPLGAFVGLRGAEAIFLSLAALLVFVVSTGVLSRLRPDWGRIRALLKSGAPLALSAIAIAIYMRVDQVMLGHLAPEEELGRYSIAVRVVDVAMVVPIALHASFFASLMRAHEAGPARFEAQSQRIYDAMIVATIGTMAAVAFACWLLFVPVFGAPYAPGLPMVYVLLLGLPWIGLGTARSAVLVARQWLWLAPATTALGAIVNVALNLWLIPRFGGIGAAWATVASYWLSAHGTSFMFARLRADGISMTRALNPFAAAGRLVRGYRAELNAA